MSNLNQTNLDEISAQICETERLIHERVNRIVAGLKNGFDVSADETRVAEMRFVLVALRTRRKKIARAHFLSSETKLMLEARE